MTVGLVSFNRQPGQELSDTDATVCELRACDGTVD